MRDQPIPNLPDDTVSFNVWLSPGIRERVRRVAWRDRRTIRSVVIEAFEKYLAWDEQTHDQDKTL